MNLGLIPHPAWHFAALALPIFIWRLALPWAKSRHISRWLTTSLQVSFWEEGIFRGLLYGITKWLSGSTAIAIVISSLIFGLFHARNLWWASPRRVVNNCLYNGLISGPIFALVRYWTGDIYLAVLIHFLHNVVNMRLASNIPIDEFLASKRGSQNWFQRFFAGDWRAG